MAAIESLEEALNAALDEARAEEREACARLVDSWADNTADAGRQGLLRDIAHAMRSGAEAPEGEPDPMPPEDDDWRPRAEGQAYANYDAMRSGRPLPYPFKSSP